MHSKKYIYLKYNGKMEGSSHQKQGMNYKDEELHAIWLKKDID